MRNMFLMLAGTAIFIVVVGLFTSGKLGPREPISQSVKVGNLTIPIELADTQSTRAKGLSGRSSLDKNSGLLFVLDSKDSEPIFWMKDMLIPIDIIWIKEEKIVKIDANVPAPASGTADKDLKLYKSGGPVDHVLEVNAGFCQDNNIKVGDSVSL